MDLGSCVHACGFETQRPKNMLIPNGTTEWLKFKDDVLSRVRTGQELRFETSFFDTLTLEQKEGLTELLYRDAGAAYMRYLDHLSRSATKRTF